MTGEVGAFISPAERVLVLERLRERYAGVWSAADVERHADEYVGRALADAEVSEVLDHVAPGSRVLDVGSGFGSFVLAAREAGLEAFGLEIGHLEVVFAATRLRRLGRLNAIVHGTAFALPFADASFAAVTVWNVLEHVSDPAPVLREIHRVLRPGGHVHVVCPNYAAMRPEAHYHLLWLPLMPRRLGEFYLRARGRDPRFFREAIHYRTNWGVLRALRRSGLTPLDDRSDKLRDPSRIRDPRRRTIVRRLSAPGVSTVVRLLLAATFWNPLRASVIVRARKA